MFELYLGDVSYPEGNAWDKAYKRCQWSREDRGKATRLEQMDKEELAWKQVPNNDLEMLFEFGLPRQSPVSCTFL